MTCKSRNPRIALATQFRNQNFPYVTAASTAPNSTRPRMKTPPIEQEPMTTEQQALSYWSVLEQQAFPRLLEYYGSDWQQIAGHLNNKTAAMASHAKLVTKFLTCRTTSPHTSQVKNYYHRSVERCKGGVWDAIIKKADDRIKSRKKLGPLGEPLQTSLVPRKRPAPSP